MATSANQPTPTMMAYTESAADRSTTPPSTYTFTAKPTVDSDLSYDQISSFRQGSAGGRYTVRGGDTLPGIALAVYGDASYWYKIAEANGLSGDALLVDGQSLNLPSGVTRSKNNASTFKPYDAAETLGNTSPTAPKPPKKKGCGMMGQILLTVIAIAVTIITTPVLGPVGAAIAGNVVSQVVGVATGIQDQFSWKSVALTAVTAGIGQGLDKIGAFKQLGIAGRSALATGARAVVTNGLAQGVAVATGLQKKFDWASVAAAGVGAGVGHAVGGQIAGQGLGKFGERLATNMASGIANAATRSLINGTSFGDNLIAALPDVLGQTIGGMIADGVAGRPAARALSDEPISVLSTGSLVPDQVPIDMGSMVAPGISFGVAEQPIVGAGGGQVGQIAEGRKRGQPRITVLPGDTDDLDTSYKTYISTIDLNIDRSRIERLNSQHLAEVGHEYDNINDVRARFDAEYARLEPLESLANSAVNQRLFATTVAPVAIASAAVSAPLLLTGELGILGTTAVLIDVDYAQSAARGYSSGRFGFQSTVGGSLIGERNYAIASGAFGLFTAGRGFYAIWQEGRVTGAGGVAATKGASIDIAANEAAWARAAATAEGPYSLVGANRAIVDPRKLTEYALNPAHPVGGNKARVFDSAFGFNASNADELMIQLRQGVMNNPATLGKVDQYGTRLTVDIPVAGPTGSGQVRTGWIYRPGSNTPELTTLFPK